MNVTKAVRVPILILMGAIALVEASCADSAAARKALAVKANTPRPQEEQAQKPVKLRYYGGPKSPMYPG
jgi:hypothetical protein